jgi:methionyl-tRNA formyltransferase
VRIAVAATAPLGASVLEGLAGRHEIELLLTRPDRPKGRGRQLGASPAKEAALRLGIPVVQPERPGQAAISAPVVVVCAYGALIPESLLDERLWLNVHPSLLPRWRGAAPVERAIMAGDRTTGVTIHRTTAALDAGPIAQSRSFPIGPQDDAGVVYETAARLAVELVDVLLDHVETIRFHPQPDEGITYAEKIQAADRQLDWSGTPEQIVDHVRALSPHIGARTVVADRPLTVWRARSATTGSAFVERGVELLEVQRDGGRRMSGAEYLRGSR